MEYHETGIIITLSPSDKWDEVCDSNLYIKAIQDYLFKEKPEHIKEGSPDCSIEIYRVVLSYGFIPPTIEDMAVMRHHRDYLRNLMVGMYDAISNLPAEAVKEYVI